MQVNSIDTQVLIPRTMDASKAQSTRDQQPIVQQDIGAMLLQREEDVRSKKVLKSEQAEGKKIKDEEKKKQRREKQEKAMHASKRQDDEPEEIIYMAVDAVRGHNIDIST